MSTALLNLDSFADAQQEFSKFHKNTGEKMFAKYLSGDGCFVKTIILLTVMITTMLSKLKMNLCIAPEKRAFANYRDHAKILVVFKRWYNCSISCESCCSHN